MSLRAFAVLAAVAAGGAALAFGPMAVLDAAWWLRRRFGRPADGHPLTREEKRALRAIRRDFRRQDAYTPAYDKRRQP